MKCSTATELGIRSFTLDTRLADLNHGRGVFTQAGADFLIRRKDGVELNIDLDSPTAVTIGDVLDHINNHPSNTGAAVVARLARFGNGIELADANLAGADTLAVEPINLARTAEDLGFIGTASISGGEEVLTGKDVNPSETPGIFTALIRLRDALLTEDVPGISRSIEVLDAATTTLNFSRAELGARQQALDILQTRLDDEEIELRDKLSKEHDVDLVEAISELTARQAALEASLRTLAQTVQLTLLNFL